jgi:hypothetical protein
MKVSQESTSLMTLKDYNATQFLAGLVFFAVGAAIIWFVVLAQPPEKQLLLLAFNAIFILAGLGLILWTKLVSISLDKGSGKARFSLWSIIKRESREVEIRLIKGITLVKELRRGSKGSTRRQFIINFVLEGGEEIPFEFGSLSGGMDVLTNPEEGIRNKAKEVAAFLNVPLKEIGPPSAHETLSAVKDTIMAEMEKRRPR